MASLTLTSGCGPAAEIYCQSQNPLFSNCFLDASQRGNLARKIQGIVKGGKNVEFKLHPTYQAGIHTSRHLKSDTLFECIPQNKILFFSLPKMTNSALRPFLKNTQTLRSSKTQIISGG